MTICSKSERFAGRAAYNAKMVDLVFSKSPREWWQYKNYSRRNGVMLSRNRPDQVPYQQSK